MWMKSVVVFFLGVLLKFVWWLGRALEFWEGVVLVLVLEILGIGYFGFFIGR